MSFRWRAIQFIGQEEAGEDRSLVEIKLLFSHIENMRASDIGWHQVGRELNAIVSEPKQFCY